MSILKNKLSERFSQLPNELIEDTRISAKAFRVAAYLFSRPSGWKIMNADIMKKLSIKDERSLSKYWKELIESGWISRERERGESGSFSGGYDYSLNFSPVVSEEPESEEKPNQGKTQIREKSTLGKNPDTLSNTDLVSNTKEINNKNIAQSNACAKDSCSNKSTEAVPVEKQFEIFWDHYGHKKSKTQAFRAFKKLSLTDRRAAYAGVKPYNDYLEKTGISKCHPATYLNNRRWEDDFTVIEKQKQKEPSQADNYRYKARPTTIMPLPLQEDYAKNVVSIIPSKFKSQRQ